MYHGLGTTLVAACLHGNTVVVANVGDSRAYFLRDGACIQITEDHTYIAGAPPGENRDTLQVAFQESLQQYITRAVDTGPEVNADYYKAQLGPGDAVLLATDGLTRYANAQDIAREVRETDAPGNICRRLVALAHSHGAADNVTCLLMVVI